MVQAPDDGSIRKRVAVALLSDERVLLIHRWRDGDEYYVVPGGGVEPGEAIEDAARRELREEASAVVDGKLTPLITFDGFDERHKIRHRFIAFTAAASSQVVEMSPTAPEIAAISAANRYRLEWVDLAALASLDLQPPEVKAALLALSV